MKNRFIFFWKAIKIAGSAQKNRVGRVSGNTGDFFLGLMADGAESADSYRTAFEGSV